MTYKDFYNFIETILLPLDDSNTDYSNENPNNLINYLNYFNENSFFIYLQNFLLPLDDSN